MRLASVRLPMRLPAAVRGRCGRGRCAYWSILGVSGVYRTLLASVRAGSRPLGDDSTGRPVRSGVKPPLALPAPRKTRRRRPVTGVDRRADWPGTRRKESCGTANAQSGQ